MAQTPIVNHPWLPKTKTPLGGGAASGSWQGQSPNFLNTLASGLDGDSGTATVNSLPTPWSRALQFEQAVLDTLYPTRNELLEELFGSMACLGLWEMFGLRVEAERVALLELMQQTDEAVGPFSRSLISCLPDGNNALSAHPEGRNPWETVYVISVEGTVIGFSSPSTLFCPAVHLPKPIRGMGWSTGGKFSSPVSHLGTPQRQSLAEWFSHLRTGMLNAKDRNNQTTASQMAAVLAEWIDDLAGDSIGTPTLSTSSRIANLPANPVAVALLARPAKASAGTSRATLELGERSEVPVAETPVKPVVLVDREMPNKLGIRPADICLHKAATLETIGFDAAQLKRQYGNEIKVITPDDLFLDELYLLPGEQALMHSWLTSRLEGTPMVNGDPVTPLLPFKPKIRALFSSRELQSRVKMRVLQTSINIQLEVNLSLPLQGQRDMYTISRTYPIKDENLLVEDLPVISLWPYINNQKWNLFYIFCEDSSKGLTVDGFADYTREVVKEEQRSIKYLKTEHIPDLIRMSEGGADRGLLPVIQPPSNQSTAVNWQVGIDFGTSFTNFYIDNGDGPHRRQIETRVASLTLSEKEHRNTLLHEYFIPEKVFVDDDHAGFPPTATALHIGGWQENAGQVPEILHEARIFTPHSGSFGGPEVRTGFKWTDLHYQKPFLTELALLISANAAASGAQGIEWSVSYPSAFSLSEVSRYHKTWSNLCVVLAELTGLGHVLQHHASINGLQTEAVAFASFFGNFQKCNLIHTSCMDIGGGSTDISIWQDDLLVHQVSVPYAGRDICSKHLQLKPSLLRTLFPNRNVGLSQDEARARQDKNFNYRLDQLMRYGSNDLLAGRLDLLLNDKDPSKRKQLQEFISLLAVSFGGLYHYLGKVQEVLRQEGKLKRTGPTPVYLGGNGGRLMNWVSPASTFTKGCEPDRLMELLQAKAARCKPDGGNTTLSEAYKDETACGLISSRVNLTNNIDPLDDQIISGARIKINDLVFDESERINLSHEISSIHSYTLENLGSIKSFVDSYDSSIAELRIRSLLPIHKMCNVDDLWRDVGTEVDKLCVEKTKSRDGMPIDVADFEPEPGFILGLRALTNCLGNAWDDRF